MKPLIIIGASARAAAQSALRAGWSPHCVDLFADRDLAAIAPVRRCPLDQYPDAIPKLVADLPAGPVLLVGAMENHLEVVEQLAEHRPMLGSSIDTMRAARDPFRSAGMTAIPGVRPCKALATTPTDRNTAGDHTWLVKLRRGAGGRGIHRWNDQPIDEHHYLQEFIDGPSIAAIFVADESSCRLVGVTRQLVGLAGFAARPFHYCGSIGPISLPLALDTALQNLGDALTRTHGLRGVFGVDAILDPQNNIRPVEVNPRYTASVEILERAGAPSPLVGEGGESASRVRGGSPATMPSVLAGDPLTIPDATPHPPRARGTLSPKGEGKTLHGKAVLFAHNATAAPDFYRWFTPDEIADVPAIGEPIPAGHPVCTVFASGADESSVLAGLRDAAERLYTRLR
ncbi:MAG: ATP-grasp domain-containing protein [Planctomycetes bacterium]|nr:ATP-grasp domain-containing protein [Planctomycetota bacterium]